MSTNGQQINAERKKSNFVIFRPRQKVLTYQPKILLHDSEKPSLECKDYVNHLGILLDKTLAFKNHIDQITIKLGKTVGMIAKLRHFHPPKNTFTNLQFADRAIHLRNSCICGFAGKCHLNKIITLQKRVLRFIYFSGRRDHAIPLFLNANILPATFLYYTKIYAA